MMLILMDFSLPYNLKAEFLLAINGNIRDLQSGDVPEEHTLY